MVESTGSGDRTQIKADLHAFAEEHLKASEGYEVVDDTNTTLKVDGADQKIHIVTKRVWVEGKGYVLVAQGEVGGMTIAKFKAFRDDIANALTAMDKAKVKATKLDNADGADMAVMMQIKLPWPMSNRVIMNMFYFSEENVSNGVYTQCSSSRGNEKIVEEHKKTIGKDVVGHTHCGYMRVEETSTGAKWSSVQCVELGGSIPDMMKGKISSRQAKQGFNTINFILTGAAMPE